VGPAASYLTPNVSPSAVMCDTRSHKHQEKETHRQIFQDDYTAPSKWYHAYMGNINAEDEESGDFKARLELPVLMITAKRDIVATAKIMEAGIRQFASDVQVKELDTGHWVQLEARHEVNLSLDRFFADLKTTVK
jgi:soluble epoxide hydrolase / lipid-phosphate phosphatase